MTNILTSDGIRATGKLGSDGIGRSDAVIELTNGGQPRHALLAITNDINPGSTTEEGAISWQARDTTGAMKQTASISSVWVVAPTPGSGFASLRFNVDDVDGGSEILFRAFGKKNGATFYGVSETDYPGIPTVKFNRALGYPSIVGNADLVIEGIVPGGAPGTVFINAYNAGDVRTCLGGGKLWIGNTSITESQLSALLAKI